MTDLKSLKQPQRITAIIMFLAVFISAIGPKALGETLPFVPQVIFTGLVTACGWYITQYNSATGVESRVNVAEQLIEQNYVNDSDAE